MKDRQLGSTTKHMMFLLIQSADHITPLTGATPTVTISKDGGSFNAAVGAIAEAGNGWYKLEANATDRDTLGDFVLHVTAALADITDDRYGIVAYDPFDSAALGLSSVPSNVKKVNDITVGGTGTAIDPWGP